MVRRVRETPLIRPQSVEFVDALMPHQIPLVRLPISILQCKAHSVRCVECVRRVGHIRCVGCAAANFFLYTLRAELGLAHFNEANRGYRIK